MSDAATDVRTIDRDELLEMINGGEDFRLVMALNEWAYRAKHIPGSEHFNTPEELFASLSPEDQIVVYCTSDECHSSVALYHALVDGGYRNVRRYSGGLTDWEAAGLPLEGDWAADLSTSSQCRAPGELVDPEGLLFPGHVSRSTGNGEGMTSERPKSRCHRLG